MENRNIIQEDKIVESLKNKFKSISSILIKIKHLKIIIEDSNSEDVNYQIFNQIVTRLNNIKDIFESIEFNDYFPKFCSDLQSALYSISTLRDLMIQVNNNEIIHSSIISYRPGYFISFIASTFMKLRVAIVSNFLMSKFGYVGPSDIEFNKYFPGLSKRTPDYIFKDENRKLVLIVETSFTSSTGNGVYTKGYNKVTSKYYEEIYMIETRTNYKVIYCPIIFVDKMFSDSNVRSTRHDPFKTQKKPLLKEFLLLNLSIIYRFFYNNKSLSLYDIFTNSMSFLYNSIFDLD
jgi:hypothetical protein